jgi:hypothetical protein
MIRRYADYAAYTPEQRLRDLHDAVVPNADGPDVAFRDLEDPGLTQGTNTLIFRDHRSALIREITRSKIVFGCVAWLTDPEILRSLCRPQYGCAIVIQKEDFLRVDESEINARSWEVDLRRNYEALHCSLERFNLPTPANELSTLSDPTVDPVRCVGNHNAEKNPASPRMHNKFAVFADVIEEFDERYGVNFQRVKPYAVWTGSCNWTVTSGRSFENAVLIHDPKIAKAYLTEWSNIFCLSEPLDWESPWVTPQYRIGT